MKFKYVGDLPIKNVDLVVAGIYKPHDVITKNTIIDIPDNNSILIQRMRVNGNYEEVKQLKIGKNKKSNKKKKEEKEEK